MIILFDSKLLRWKNIITKPSKYNTLNNLLANLSVFKNKVLPINREYNNIINHNVYNKIELNNTWSYNELTRLLIVNVIFNIIIRKAVIYMKYNNYSSNNNIFIFEYKQSEYYLLYITNVTGSCIMNRHLNCINIIAPKLNSIKYIIKLIMYNISGFNMFGILMAIERCLSDMLI